MKRKVCVVTGTRAEYGLFYPIMRQVLASKQLQLQIVATTMHFSEEFGLTYKQIEKDGFIINEKIENLLATDSKSGVVKSTGLAMILLSDTFLRMSPDVVLLLGDRFETHAAATTAMLMNIPIAHIHGGEVTEGAVDEQIRHAITKMAYLHFTSTEVYKNRVIQMGEEPEHVICTGAPGLDNIYHMDFLSKEDLENELRWKITSPTALFTFHSETLSNVSIFDQISHILKLIQASEINVLFTYANADDGGRVINKAIEIFVKQNKIKYRVEKSLGQLKYLSAMKHVDLLIGNTSSGIIEAASLKKAVVNIGNRQQGRLQSSNIINCTIDGLESAVFSALEPEFVEQCKNVTNLYGNGNASAQIVQYLEKTPLTCKKRFFDI